MTVSQEAPKEDIPFTIPTIDLSAYLTSPTSPAAQEIISQVRTACQTSGFFQLTGHGVPVSLQKAVFGAAKRVFALPKEVKDELSMAKTGTWSRGYEVIGGQALQEGTLPDLKEGYYVSKEQSTPQKSFLLVPNVWPPSSQLPDADFKDPVSEYYNAVHALALKVMEVLAATLPHGPNVFDHFNTNAAAVIRLLHYPPQKKDEDEEETTAAAGAEAGEPVKKEKKIQLGAGAHTDFGAITLLLQDTEPGLEVLNPTKDSWEPVPPTPNAFVVNVGDMLSFWTGGLYRSSVHRVRNLGGGDRYSVPFFFDGNPETLLGPLGREPGEGERVLTVEDHMKERFETTYGRGKDGKKGGGGY